LTDQVEKLELLQKLAKVGKHKRRVEKLIKYDEVQEE